MPRLPHQILAEIDIVIDNSVHIAGLVKQRNKLLMHIGVEGEEGTHQYDVVLADVGHGEVETVILGIVVIEHIVRMFVGIQKASATADLHWSMEHI